MTNASPFYTHLAQELDAIRSAGLYKAERIINSPQSAHITTTLQDGSQREVLNLCANNYLGLSSHPAVMEAWLSASLMMASSSPSNGSNKPPLASKAAA